jgi:tetratricopeptide (TPR) repeat protein
MVRRFRGRPSWLFTVALIASLAAAVPAFAQSTGMVKGVVTDDKGQPIDGAKVTLEMVGGTGRKFETKTNKKGEYIQIGLYPGEYKITATKDNLSSSVDAKIGLGDPEMLDIKLAPAAPSKEQADQNAKVQAVFAEGIAAAKAEKWDDAIAKFTEAAGIVPNCHVCYFNIGAAYYSKEDQAKAEENYKKSVEIKPDYADGWNALASLYNQQKKFDLAAEASANAAKYMPAGGGGGNAEAAYNQGVILFNGGKFAEAKTQFEAATKADPNHAMAQYQLGMTALNLGQIQDAVNALEAYLKVDPMGPKAAEVKGSLPALQAMLKK